MNMSMRLGIAITLAATLAVPRAFAAEDSLAAAKDLYASASYEDALVMLERLAAAKVTDADTGAPIDEYRAFCLFALGRTAEAEGVAAELFRRYPLLSLQSEEMSPRVTALFTETRRRVLPTLIREKYKTGRTAVERKDFAAAESDLLAVRALIAQARTLGIEDDSFGDLGTLADGFLLLATTSASARPAAPQAPPPAAAANAPSAVGNADPTRTYGSGDLDVTAPLAIRQQIPGIPADVINKIVNQLGILEVVVERDGTVSNATMRRSVHPLYDAILVKAARAWRYQPAVKGGTPVRYLKVVALTISQLPK